MRGVAGAAGEWRARQAPAGGRAQQAGEGTAGAAGSGAGSKSAGGARPCGEDDKGK